MSRGVSKKREAMALFRDRDSVPLEMRPTGKGAGAKGIPVVVLKQTAKMVTLQYTAVKRGRAKQVLRCIADFPVEMVVLYNIEAIDVEEAEAPEATAPKRRGRPPKKRVDEDEETPVKKRRGRPPKKRVDEDEAPVKKRRGRPPKKKGKKTRKFGSSSRRKSFNLEDDDE